MKLENLATEQLRREGETAINKRNHDERIIQDKDDGHPLTAEEHQKAQAALEGIDYEGPYDDTVLTEKEYREIKYANAEKAKKDLSEVNKIIGEIQEYILKDEAGALIGEASFEMIEKSNKEIKNALDSRNYDEVYKLNEELLKHIDDYKEAREDYLASKKNVSIQKRLSQMNEIYEKILDKMDAWFDEKN